MVNGRSVRDLLATAQSRLVEAGVDSPDVDARRLLAAAAGVEPSGLLIIDTVDESAVDRFEAMVGRRERREPLQHITGTAHFRHVQLQVGPGVFVPRPETEVMAGWAIDRLRDVAGSGRAPVVVDLCTGSGAIAAAIADEVADASVHAVELSEQAAEWAAKNLAVGTDRPGGAVELRVGDMAAAYPDLDGTVDLVVCNPPYIPLTAWESVQVEARDHDPELALFSGDDGLDAVRTLTAVAHRLLRDGGWVACEHAELQVDSVPALFARHGGYDQIRDHRDLADRPRFTVARRTGRRQ